MRIRHIIIAILGTAAVLSCAEQERKLTIADQEAAIDNYVTQNFADYPVVYKDGSVRVNIIDSTAVESADSLEYGDTLTFYYAGYTFNNAPTSLFCTNNETVAQENGFTTSEADYSAKELVMTRHCLVSGLEHGLLGVREDGHYIILFSAEHGFYNNYVYNIPKLSALAYEIWITELRKQQ
ncbi:MAG TPA: hypothetical protein IAC03_08630 [Candidatus Coprenecus pullistercoris]|nr:hypothetical protein [Candidatus Coprenecus pullistercoris]